MRGPLHKFLERLWPPPTGAAHVSWWLRVGALCCLGAMQLAQNGYQHKVYRGWPAVACVQVSPPTVILPPGAPVAWPPPAPSPGETFHSPWSYAINVVAALAVVALTWLLDRVLRLRQFTLREIFGVMLCIGVFLACVRMGRTHSAQFLEECGLHGAAGLMRRDWHVRFRS